jgi:hypothetical protein
MPLERAHMRIRILLPQKEAKKIRPKLDDFMAKVLDEQWAGDLELVCDDSTRSHYDIGILRTRCAGKLATQCRRII